MWDKLPVLVAVVSVLINLILGFFTYHLGQQKNTFDQQKEVYQVRLDQEKTELDRVQKQLDLANKELENVKKDLNQYVRKETGNSGGQSQTGELSGKVFQFNLMKSQPLDVMSNLKMEITDLVFKPTSNRYAVSARVNYKDLPEMTIGNAEVGYKVTYPEKNGYNIEVIETTAVSAKFAISKSHR